MKIHISFRSWGPFSLSLISYCSLSQSTFHKNEQLESFAGPCLVCDLQVPILSLRRSIHDSREPVGCLRRSLRTLSGRKMTITWEAPRLNSAHFHGSPNPLCQSSGCTFAARALVVTVRVAGARVAHYAARAEGLSITPET